MTCGRSFRFAVCTNQEARLGEARTPFLDLGGPFTDPAKPSRSFRDAFHFCSHPRTPSPKPKPPRNPYPRDSFFEVPRTKLAPASGPTHAPRSHTREQNKRGGPVMARPVVPTRQSTVLFSSLQHAMLRDTFPARYVGFTTSKAYTLRRLCKHTAVSAHTTWSARRPGATITHKVTRKQQLTTKVPAVSMLFAKWRKCASRKVPQLREHVQRLPRDCEWQPIPVDSARL